MNAYVNDKMHLIIVLSNGTEIDAGYVGVETVDPAPDPDPEPEITDPTVVVSSATAKAGDAGVEITVALKNNPGVTSMMMRVTFDDTVLELENMIYNAAIGGNTVSNESDGSPVTIYWTDGFKDVTGDWTLVTLKFNVSDTAAAGKYDILLTYNADDIFDADEVNVSFDVVDGSITVS